MRFSQFNQIINLIQNIVVVPISSNTQKLNINASVSMSISATPLNMQSNPPYEIKYKVVMLMLKRIRTFNKYKTFM